jgi:hypothetical protein
MPYQTPDASAFIRQKKLNSIQQRNVNDVKYLTHLYTYVPPSSALVDFLPRITNKIVSPFTLSLQGVPPPQKLNYVYVAPKYIR